MSAAETILALARRGIDLRLDDGKLRARAPRGWLSDDDRAVIDQERDEIVAALAIVAETVENVSREPTAVFDAWRSEIVDGVRWVETGKTSDPHLALDILALRRFVPHGRCLACGAGTGQPGENWCAGCETSRSRGSA